MTMTKLESLKNEFYRELKLMELSRYKDDLRITVNTKNDINCYEFNDDYLNELTEREIFLLKSMCIAVRNLSSKIDNVQGRVNNATNIAYEAKRHADLGW